MVSIAFVGAGPTTLYVLKALLAAPLPGLCLTVFEAQAEAGVGSPYSRHWNDPGMLSNIASAEIPPVTETLLAWLQAQPDDTLREMTVDAARLDDRTFVPRVALGRYFRSQFERLVTNARLNGVRTEVRTGCRVLDVANESAGVDVTWASGEEMAMARFDHVVLATGHQWPSRQEATPGYFTSPWPATTLAGIGPTHVGIRGSSLTALDAAVALAGSHGVFARRADGQLVYAPAEETDAFRITLMSRKGLLPEADFYFPLPHRPLAICTPDAIRRLIAQGGEALLDRVFDLFRLEMIAVDADYAETVALSEATVESFGEAYFARRIAVDPFVWAETNLSDARASHARRLTSAWRDALLRMHEGIATIAPYLDDAQFDRFSRCLKPVFVDAYGAVPHETVERVLALHRAGKLEVLALGDDYRIETRASTEGAHLVQGHATRWFPVFIEATGQKVLGAIQFPFLSLIQQGIVRDAALDNAARGIDVDQGFSLVADGVPPDRLFCLSLPFIMGRHPFAQGITSSHHMGEAVGRRLAAIVSERAEIDSLSAVA